MPQIFLALCLAVLSMTASAQAPLVSLPAPDTAAIDAARERVRPFIFAVPIELSWTTADVGSWTEAGTERRWSAELFADQATSLSLHFSRMQLPAGATLTIFDVDGEAIDIYDSAVNTRQQVWSSQGRGDRLRLELSLPADIAADEFDLVLGRAFYGFRGADAFMGYANLKNAGACNIDVACSQADPFSEQVRSTVLLSIDGSGLCTGNLINNTAQDQTPFVLTADHCEIDSANDESIVFYFDYQRQSCQTGQPYESRQRISLGTLPHVNGSQLLADRAQSDFTLLIMGSANSPAAIPAQTDPYWMGWTRSLTPASAGAGIHHPSGTEKSIAIFSEPLVAQEICPIGQASCRDDERVSVWVVTWSDGTTEQGSSGSAIFGDDGLVRGALYGGGASCSSQTEPDVYGRFDVSWDTGDCPSAQLRSWLDPLGTNPTSLAGLDHDDSPAQPTPSRVQASCSSTPTPSPTQAPSSDGGGSGALHGLMLMMLLLSLRRWQSGVLRPWS